MKNCVRDIANNIPKEYQDAVNQEKRQCNAQYKNKNKNKNNDL